MGKSIYKDVLADYNAGTEKDRLRTGLGRVEFARTKELLLEFLPPADTQSRAHARKRGKPYGPQHAPAGNSGKITQHTLLLFYRTKSHIMIPSYCTYVLEVLHV